MVKVRKQLEPVEPVRVSFPVEEGMTRQSMKDECDINIIMRKYQKTGAVAHVREFGAFYGDVEPVTFHEAMETIRQANEMFAALPSSVRKRFSNDPSEFLDFVSKPQENEAELRKLGLWKRTPEPEPAPAGESGPE